MKVFLGIVIFFAIFIYFLPKDKEQNSIEYIVQKLILMKTPRGSDIDTVMSYCELKEWKCRRNDNTGARNAHTGEIIGVKSISTDVLMTKLLPLLTISVSAYWGFDENGKLIDVFIWQIFDSL